MTFPEPFSSLDETVLEYALSMLDTESRDDVEEFLVAALEDAPSSEDLNLLG